MFLTVATAGHIDHGKSALVQALTGVNPDRLKEEQARGISIELGFAHTHVGDVTLSFIDVPGHERFVRTMLAGVGGIDAALIVVAADESVMPQTREHVAICRLLDVPAAVVALTKIDVADDTMQAVAADDVRDLLAGSPLAGAEIVPVSARAGDGLDALRTALVRCAARRRPRLRDAPARLPIDRAFSVKGFGTVVTGTLWTGGLALDQTVRIEPRGVEARIRTLQVHGESTTVAEAGQRVAVNLAGVSLDEVARGDALVTAGAVLVTRRVAVDVHVLADAPPMRHGTRVHVHLGTAVVLGRVLVADRVSGAVVSDSGGASQRAVTGLSRAAGARSVAPDERALVLVRLESPLPARRGDRVVLRTYSPVATVAGGVIVDPWPSARTRALTRLAQSAAMAPDAWLAARIDEAGVAGIADADLCARLGVSAAEAAGLAQSAASTGAIAKVGTHWVSGAALSEMREQMLARVDEEYARDPSAGGVLRATLLAHAARRGRVEMAAHVLDALVGAGVLVGQERVSRPSTGTLGVRDPAELEARAQIEGAGLAGLTVLDLQARVGTSTPAVVARLVKAGEVVRLGDLIVAAASLDALSADLRALALSGTAPAAIDVGWFKDRYALTRRAAIPLLEWLDRTRVTRRQGGTRVLIAVGG